MINNEIKEILEKLKDGNWYNELDLTGTMWIELRWEETHLLLDYINNLQEQLHQASLDIQELTERDIECPSWCDKLINLQQENERLKEQVNDNKVIIEYAIKPSFTTRKLQDYKSRIEKAVEYVEKAKEQDFMWTPIFMKELLNILNGGNNE